MKVSGTAWRTSWPPMLVGSTENDLPPGSDQDAGLDAVALGVREPLGVVAVRRGSGEAARLPELELVAAAGDVEVLRRLLERGLAQGLAGRRVGADKPFEGGVERRHGGRAARPERREDRVPLAVIVRACRVGTSGSSIG